MMQLTPAICRAAAQDAGNRSMRRAGRAAWNADDWNAAVAELDRLTLLMADDDPTPISRQSGALVIAAERRRVLRGHDRCQDAI